MVENPANEDDGVSCRRTTRVGPWTTQLDTSERAYNRERTMKYVLYAKALKMFSLTSMRVFSF